MAYSFTGVVCLLLLFALPAVVYSDNLDLDDVNLINHANVRAALERRKREIAEPCGGCNGATAMKPCTMRRCALTWLKALNQMKTKAENDEASLCALPNKKTFCARTKVLLQILNSWLQLCNSLDNGPLLPYCCEPYTFNIWKWNCS